MAKMSVSVYSVDKLLKQMDYETVPPQTNATEALHSSTMHSEESDDTDSKCSSPVNSHSSEPLDIRNASNLSQDILQTMIQSCRRFAASEQMTTGCECRSEGKQGQEGRCEKCTEKRFNINLSESYQKDKCNTIINEPVKPVLKFSVSAILSGTKSSSDDRAVKNGHRNGKQAVKKKCFN